MSSSTVVIEAGRISRSALPAGLVSGNQVHRAGDDIFHTQRKQRQQNDNPFCSNQESTSDSGRSLTPQPVSLPALPPE